MFFVDWNALIRLIDRSLPGRGLWMHCAPVFDPDRPTEEGVGLAVQRESGPKGRWYVVVFFSVVPSPEAVGPDGDFLPGRGEEVSDWVVDVGYQGDFDALEEAIGEAKDLAPRLPKSAIYPTAERFHAFLEEVTDPGDLEEIT
ncbi:MAG: hypothetical protein M3522_05955 [Actinomycetota bacterium]|nr:hypothetical protein [Actinomycetota bacterium]